VLRGFLIFALAGIWHVCAAAAPLPERFSAEFAVEVRGFTVGKTEVTLRPEGEGRAVYESRTTTTGLVSLFRSDRILERSVLRYQPSGKLRPLVYRYQRSGGKEKTVTIDFDWEHGVAHNTEEGRSWRFPIPDGTLDKLSYVLALMRDLERGEREFRYRVNARGKLKTYHLRVVGEERLQTALGGLNTLEVKRVRDPESRQETVVWCAERLHYLPVKIRDRDSDGTVTTLRIRSVQGFGAERAAGEREHARPTDRR